MKHWIASCAVLAGALSAPGGVALAAGVTAIATVPGAPQRQVRVDGDTAAMASNLGPAQGTSGSRSSAMFSADLATGLIRSSTLAVNATGTIARGELSDTITFLAPRGAPASTRFPSTLSLWFSGTMDLAAVQTGDNIVGTRLQQALTALTLELASTATPARRETVELTHDIRKRYITAPNGSTRIEDVSPGLDLSTSTNGNASIEEATDVALTGVLSLAIDPVPGEAWALSVDALTGAGSGLGWGSSIDFSETAILSLTVPEGYGFTSESGVFLTAPIPLPPAAWCLVSGLALLLARPQRKPTQAAR